MRRRATTACIQCRACTDLCPRHLVGHGFQTHLVMRAFAAGAEAGPATQQALLCSECGVCELFACPMQLSPRRINALLKARFREARQGFQGERRVIPEQAALRPYRKVPSQRLARRVGLGPYLGLHPEFREGFAVDEVCIPLGQHIGAPAAAAVRAGDRVEEGAVVGEIPPEAKLGARIHASIPGQVIEAGTSVRIRRS
jgi:Na+-translocating ferredoxin:NAD+ oxidoreductase RnfC subunit